MTSRSARRLGTVASLAFACAVGGTIARADEENFRPWARENRNALRALELGREGKAGEFLSMKDAGSLDYNDEYTRNSKLFGLKRSIEQVTSPAAEARFQAGLRACPTWAKERAEDDDNRTTVQVCDLIAKRKAYWDRYVAACITEAASVQSKDLDDSIEHIDKDGLVQQTDIDRFRAPKVEMPAVQLIVEATGGARPKDVEAAAEKNRTRFNDALARASAKNRWSPRAKGSDTTIQTAARTRLSGLGLQMVKMGLFETAWNVKKNDFGLPVERTRLIGVATKSAGESFCRIYDLTAAQDYEGGGKYGGIQFYNKGFGSFLVSKC